MIACVIAFDAINAFDSQKIIYFIIKHAMCA
jgi:hypothetical protein